MGCTCATVARSSTFQIIRDVFSKKATFGGGRTLFPQPLPEGCLLPNLKRCGPQGASIFYYSIYYVVGGANLSRTPPPSCISPQFSSELLAQLRRGVESSLPLIDHAHHAPFHDHSVYTGTTGIQRSSNDKCFLYDLIVTEVDVADVYHLRLLD